MQGRQFVYGYEGGQVKIGGAMPEEIDLRSILEGTSETLGGTCPLCPPMD